MKLRVGMIFVIVILVFMPAVESKNYDLPQEDLARDGITLKESEGWRLDSIVTLPVFSTDASGRRVPSWGGRKSVV